LEALNGLPEVGAMLQKHFDGTPITKVPQRKSNRQISFLLFLCALGGLCAKKNPRKHA
jgi:hypothetical protein